MIELLTKCAYYLLGAVNSLLIVLMFSNAFYGKTKYQGDRSSIAAVVASVIAAAVLYKAFKVGHQFHRWGGGLALVVASMLVLLIVFILITFSGTVNWQ